MILNVLFCPCQGSAQTPPISRPLSLPNQVDLAKNPTKLLIGRGIYYVARNMIRDPRIYYHVASSMVTDPGAYYHVEAPCNSSEDPLQC
jgi:hypothetical protein